MLHLDALAHQHLESGWLPNLRSHLRPFGITRLLPGLAYEGITASMMTGRSVAEHGVWVHFYQRDHPADWRVRLLSTLPERMNCRRPCASFGTIHGLPARAARMCLGLPGQRVPWDRYQCIPLPWLGQFDFAIPRYRRITDYDEFGGWATLSSLARRRGRRAGEIYGEWEQVLAQLPGLLQETDFVFVHTLMELDHLGHAHGPESSEVRDYLRLVDRSLPSLLESLLRSTGGEATILVFSDHGMCPVTRHIDLGGTVRLALAERNALMFVDSTLLRVWVRDSEARARWEDRIRAISGLRVLGESERAALPADRAVVGDLTAAAEPGSLILPNYWQGDTPVKGMHGYASDDDWQTAFLSVVSAQPVDLPEPGRPEDVFTFAKRALEDE